MFCHANGIDCMWTRTRKDNSNKQLESLSFFPGYWRNYVRLFLLELIFLTRYSFNFFIFLPIYIRLCTHLLFHYFIHSDCFFIYLRIDELLRIAYVLYFNLFAFCCICWVASSYTFPIFIFTYIKLHRLHWIKQLSDIGDRNLNLLFNLTCTCLFEYSYIYYIDLYLRQNKLSRSVAPSHQIVL